MKMQLPEDILGVQGTAIKGVNLAVRTAFAVFTSCFLVPIPFWEIHRTASGLVLPVRIQPGFSFHCPVSYPGSV